jgi:L-fuculose-phosphate aldolase
MTEAEIRAALIHYSQLCIERGLSNATAGNISMRWGTDMLITPSSIPPDRMQPDEIAEVAFDGSFNGPRKPSSEWELHARIYQANPQAQAIVHAHPTYCVAISSLRKPIPCFHYMVAGFGGDEIPLAPYHRFGSPALAKAVVDTLGSRYSACLMANHGMIAYGKDLRGAFADTEKLEVLAQQFQFASAMGAPVLLTPEEMVEVHAAYRALGYGQARFAR